MKRISQVWMILVLAWFSASTLSCKSRGQESSVKDKSEGEEPVKIAAENLTPELYIKLRKQMIYKGSGFTEEGLKEALKDPNYGLYVQWVTDPHGEKHLASYVLTWISNSEEEKKILNIVDAGINPAIAEADKQLGTDMEVATHTSWKAFFKLMAGAKDTLKIDKIQSAFPNGRIVEHNFLTTALGFSSYNALASAAGEHAQVADSAFEPQKGNPVLYSYVDLSFGENNQEATVNKYFTKLDQNPHLKRLPGNRTYFDIGGVQVLVFHKTGILMSGVRAEARRIVVGPDYIDPDPSRVARIKAANKEGRVYAALGGAGSGKSYGNKRALDTLIRDPIFNSRLVVEVDEKFLTSWGLYVGAQGKIEGAIPATVLLLRQYFPDFSIHLVAEEIHTKAQMEFLTSQAMLGVLGRDSESSAREAALRTVLSQGPLSESEEFSKIKDLDARQKAIVKEYPHLSKVLGSSEWPADGGVVGQFSTTSTEWATIATGPLNRRIRTDELVRWSRDVGKNFAREAVAIKRLVPPKTIPDALLDLVFSMHEKYNPIPEQNQKLIELAEAVIGEDGEFPNPKEAAVRAKKFYNIRENFMDEESWKSDPQKTQGMVGKAIAKSIESQKDLVGIDQATRSFLGDRAASALRNMVVDPSMNRIPIIAIANQGGLSQPVSEKQVNLLAKAIAEGSGRGVIAINLDTIQDANQLREILSGALNPTKKLPKLGGTDEIGFGGRQLVVSVTGTRLLPVMTQIINDQEFEHQNQKVTLANTIVVSTGATVEGFSKQLSSRDFYRASLVIDGDAEFKVALEEELTQRGLRGTRLEDALTDEGVKKFKDEVRRIYLEIDGAATEEAVKKFDEKFRVTPEALRLAFSYPGSLCHMTNALME